MTSGDEFISDLVSDKEYSYEDNERSSLKKRGRKGVKEQGLGKRKKEDNTGTDEFISEDQEDNENSLNGGTDSQNYTSNSMGKLKRKRVRKSKRNDSEDNINK